MTRTQPGLDSQEFPRRARLLAAFSPMDVLDEMNSVGNSTPERGGKQAAHSLTQSILRSEAQFNAKISTRLRLRPPLPRSLSLSLSLSAAEARPRWPPPPPLSLFLPFFAGVAATAAGYAGLRLGAEAEAPG